MRNTVLVVDDDPFQAFLLKFHLSKFVNVITASDGLDGYAKILSMTKEGTINTIKFIVTDIRMPHLDGFGFTKLLKSNTHTKHIPVFGYTASSLESVMHNAKNVGMTHVFQKESSTVSYIEKLKSFSVL